MKKRYFIFWLLVVPILGRGQGFEAIFGTNFYDFGLKVAEIPGEDSYIVVSNILTQPNTNHGISFTKIDLIGNVIWEKIDSSVKWYNDQALLIDNAGIHYSAAIGGYLSGDTILQKLYDFEGALIQDMTYVDTFESDINKLAYLDDGSIVGIGRTLLGDDKIVILKISSDGDIVWRKEYSDNKFINSYIVDSKIMPDGSILAIYSSSSINKQLLKFDSAGNSLWDIGISEHVISCDHIHAFPDNTAYLIDYHNFTVDDSYITKIDSSGQGIWGINIESHMNYVGGVLSGSGNSLYLTGVYLENNLLLQVLLHLDMDGNVIWERRYQELSPAQQYQTAGFFREANGDFVIVSDYKPLSTINIAPTVYKTDSNGNLLWHWGSTSDFYTGKIDAMPLSDGSYMILGLANEVNSNIFENYLAKVSSDGLVYTKLITGKLVYDENESCSYDNGEPSLAGWVVKATGNQTTYALAHADGSFVMPATSDTVVVAALPPNSCWTTCADPVIAIFDTVFDTVSVEIKGQATKDCPILEVDVAASVLRRCFSNNTYYLQCRNTGTVAAENVQLTVVLDSFFVFQNSSLPLAAQNGNELVFNIDSLGINEFIGFTIQVEVSCDAMLGQIHCLNFSANADNECTNSAPANPFWTTQECQPNVGAYDPNDKRGFSEGNLVERYIPADSLIEYQIRFQNTGTDTAFTVVVYDNLSSMLDIESIRNGASSHPYQMELEGDNTVKFVFENIQLPDSTVNKPASHGFVKFRIRHKPGLVPGDVIPNKAAIFFDFNEAVITNTLELEIKSPSAVKPPRAVPAAWLKVYPQPAGEVVSFAWLGDVPPHDAQLDIVNLLGQTIYSKPFKGNTMQIAGLPAGQHFYCLRQHGAVVETGKVVVVIGN